MLKNIHFVIFRFDSKNDYLPYYKDYFLDVKKEQTLLEILKQIRIDDPFLSFDENENACIKINQKTIFLGVKLSEIINEFGTKLTLEPLSFKRAVNDLIINQNDFDDKFLLFKDIALQEDRKYYDKLINIYYASNMTSYNTSYIGDSACLFAEYLLKKYPNKKEEILSILADEKSGIWYHTNTSNKIFQDIENTENRILALFDEIINHKPFINDFIKTQTTRLSNETM